jgi:glycosyltransferase involved in cell wall biosynthesis
MNNTNKIGIVWEQLEWGGVDSYLEYLINSWPNKNDQITVIYNQGNKGAERLQEFLLTDLEVEFLPIKTSFKHYPWGGVWTSFIKFLLHVFTPIIFCISYLKYLMLFRSKNFDFVIGQNGGYPGSYGVLSSLFAAKKSGVKVVSLVVHHAATKPTLMHGWFRMIIERKLGNNVLSSVIAVSNATKKSLIRNTYFFDNQNCYAKVIENGIPITVSKKKEKKEHVNFKIGMLGRLESYKGHDDLLCSISLLSKECLEKIDVEFIGSYSNDDYSRLNNIIKKLNLENKVEILGYVDESVSSIISRLDLVVMLTKTFEGFGLTVVEALHQNTPVIATNLGVVSDLFPKDSEFVVETGDFNNLARQIEKIVMSKNIENAIPKIIQDKLWKYDSVNMANRYHQHLMFEKIKVT